MAVLDLRINRSAPRAHEAAHHDGARHRSVPVGHKHKQEIPGLHRQLSWTSIPSSTCRGYTRSWASKTTVVSSELLMQSGEELLRQRVPIAQVQTQPLHQSPLLLCRIAEDMGIAAPSPQRFLQDDRQAVQEALLELRQAMTRVLEHLASTTCVVPASSSAGASSGSRQSKPPRYAHHIDVGDVDAPRADVSVTRLARARRFSRPWWHDWMQAVSQFGNMLASKGNAAEVNVFRRCLHERAQRQIVQGNIIIPNDVRAALWLWLAQYGEVDRTSTAEYGSLCTSAAKESPNVQQVADDTLRQVLKDIERTPPHLYLQGCRRSSVGSTNGTAGSRRRATERLLLAYSRYHPAVGYCQGLNFVAAMLLGILDEQSAFAVFCGLIARLPEDLYSSDPERLAQCRLQQQDIVLRSMEVELPKISQHLNSLDLDLNLFLPRWLTCLFATVLPPPATLRLWDYVLGVDGSDAVHRMALAVLGRAETKLLAAAEMTEALSALSSAAESITPRDVDIMLHLEWPAQRFEQLDHVRSGNHLENGFDSRSCLTCAATSTSSEWSPDAGVAADGHQVLEDASTDASTLISCDEAIDWKYQPAVP